MSYCTAGHQTEGHRHSEYVFRIVPYVEIFPDALSSLIIIQISEGEIENT